jgi:ParB family chromosome partitioning protein
MLDDRLPDLRSRAGHDVEDAWRQADLERDLGERQRRQRRLARRLDDDGVAAGERRCDLPRRQQQREVPRHDCGDDADRFPQGVGQVVAFDRDGLAVDFVGPAGEILEALGGRRHLDLPRLEDRLAVVQRLEAGNLIGPLHQPLADFPNQLATLAC